MTTVCSVVPPELLPFSLPEREEATVSPHVLEALFVHELPSTEAFAKDLEVAGFAPSRLQARYAVRALEACLKVARTHLYPELSFEAACWELGRRCARGFGRMVYGKVMLMGLPLLGPARFLRRLPEHLRRYEASFRIQPVQLSERSFLLECPQARGQIPDFAAGSLEEMLGLAGITPRLQVERRAVLGCNVRVHW